VIGQAADSDVLSRARAITPGEFRAELAAAPRGTAELAGTRSVRRIHFELPVTRIPAAAAASKDWYWSLVVTVVTHYGTTVLRYRLTTVLR
jgi:hypothetical protein